MERMVNKVKGNKVKSRNSLKIILTKISLIFSLK